ncbi:MAG: universal stress protein [Planctomycetales bacterium]|nr:universal stress protein [Planctomycetales bacterium]MCA9170322.1 universal stress protein [Planctomycetales bacterium]
MSKQILFATNYSKLSAEALRVATQLAKVEHARLIIAHVSELEQYPVGEPCHSQPAPDENELEALQKVVPTDADVPFEHQLLYGEPGSTEVTKPAAALIKFAKNHHVDMIVAATHGRRGLAHLLMGDVAEDLIREAPCPVVAVRHAVESET